jgi:hypothetical protein
MTATLDELLDAMRRADALRDAAGCASAESAEAVRRRFEIAQVAQGEGGAPVAVEELLQ